MKLIVRAFRGSQNLLLYLKSQTRHPSTRQEIVNRWDYKGWGQAPYGVDITYRKGMAFLDGHGNIEDWGCGTAYARKFVLKGSYVGIDGNASKFTDRVVDLREYRSVTDCIFMRHVLEHNYEWQKILANAIESFQKRMALIIFTPFSNRTHEMISWRAAWRGVPDISFNKDDLTSCFKGLQYTEESVSVEDEFGREHIFYLQK